MNKHDREFSFFPIILSINGTQLKLLYYIYGTIGKILGVFPKWTKNRNIELGETIIFLRSKKYDFKHERMQR